MSEKVAEEGDLQHQLILKAARKAGVEVNDQSALLGCPAAWLHSGNKTELLVRGIPTSWISMKTRFLCDYKQLSKEVFKQLGIPYAQSILFRDPGDIRIAEFITAGNKYVCKPQIAANGVGVRMNLETASDVLEYWETHRELGEEFLLEEQLEGDDIRIQVIGGEIAAACVREPAFVTGDGQATLIGLIEERRVVMEQQNPANKLDLDDTSMKLIADQRLSLDSIPDAGQKVWLKLVSNMGQGGVATDITDKLHPLYHRWVDEISRLMEAPYFALDLIGRKPSANPVEAVKALEINAQAEWLHHTFSEGRTHDLASEVVDALFDIH